MEHLFLSLLVLIMIAALASGFPVAFALPGSAIISIGLAAFFGYLFDGSASAYFATDGPLEWLTAGITNFRSNYWDVETDTLIAIPLFIFMGIMLQKSKIAEDLLVTMGQLFGPIPGGLGISVIFVGALLAATTGIVGATVIAMGLISLPTMLNNKYDRSLASGIVCSSGTLGQIIPPSIVLIIIADQLASAADVANTMRQADYKLITGEFNMPGEFRVGSTSAGDMFLGALLPGLVLVGLYMLYVFVYARLNPKAAPPVPFKGQFNFKFWIKVIMVIIPPLALIFAVLGSILMGIATVNQAGSIGAIGATIMAGYRLHQGKKDAYYPLLISVISIIPIFILSKNFNLNIKAVETRDFAAILVTAFFTATFLIGIVWSFWRAYKVNDVLKEVVTETKRLEVGFRTGPGGAIQDVGEEALMITGDLNLVDVQLIVQYRIGDLGAYLYNVDDPGSPDREIREGAPDGLTILDATEASLRQVVGQRSVDDILTTNKEAVQTDTLLMLQEMLNSYETGIDVLEVRLQNVRPPDEVREDFDDVVRARVDKESVINAALAYEQDQLPKARGDAEKVTNAAQAYKEERILKATGEANRFSALLGEYEKSKEVTRQRLYLEAMEEVLPGVKKYVLDPENEGNLLQFLPLNEST